MPARKRPAPSRHLCDCGADLAEALAHAALEARILRHQERHAFLDALCRDLASFFGHARRGRRLTWLQQQFGPSYPDDVDDESALRDIVAAGLRSVALRARECGDCGRVHVQQRATDHAYVSLGPSTPGYAGLFRRPEAAVPPSPVPSAPQSARRRQPTAADAARRRTPARAGKATLLPESPGRRQPRTGRADDPPATSRRRRT